MVHIDGDEIGAAGNGADLGNKIVGGDGSSAIVAAATSSECMTKASLSHNASISDDHEAEAARRCDEAWDRHAQTWQNWMLIGEWFVMARAASMREANTNQPKGKGYAAAFNRRLQDRKCRVMDAVTRAHLLKVMENEPAIEAWRATLTESQRLSYNHPSTVIRKWKAATVVKGEKPKRPTLREAVVKLEQENHDLKRSLLAGEGGNQITPDSTPRDVARVAAEGRSYNSIRQIIKALEQLAGVRKRADEAANANDGIPATGRPGLR